MLEIEPRVPILRADKADVLAKYLGFRSGTKYNLPASSVLAPVEPVVESKSLIRCFYHGTSSHVKDWEFVIEIARQVQQRNNNIEFEFIGDHALYKKCKGIPKVQILHPMQWQDYLSMTTNRTMDIGLAPLLGTSFNKARSHTKFLDICRQNAVGIYSPGFPFSSEINERNAGLVLPNNLDSWVAGIEQLAVADRRTMWAKFQLTVGSTSVQQFC